MFIALNQPSLGIASLLFFDRKAKPRLKVAVTGSCKYLPINYQSKAASYTALLLYRYYLDSILNH